MTYPCAYKGVSKIFIAELVGLIASVAAGVIECFLPAGGNAVSVEPNTLSVLTTAGLVLSLAGGVFVTVFEIMGVRQAAVDEAALCDRPDFNKALICAIASITANIALTSAFNTAPYVSAAVSCALWVLVAVFVLRGVMRFSKRFGDGEVSLVCGRSILFISVCQFLSIACTLLPGFISFDPPLNTVLTAVSVSFSAAAIVLFLRCLAKAKNLLREN